MKLTDPSYISEQMFDKVLREKFMENTDDVSVREQAISLMRTVGRSQSRSQILVDIMHAMNASRSQSKEALAEIAFCMGLQFGFELGMSYPPLRRE